MNNSVALSMRRDRQNTTALSVPRSMRPHENSVLMKMMPGVVVPVAAAGLLREDAVAAGQLALTFEMSETAEVLINPVVVKVSAYLVPWLAFERFYGRDEFEASYSKKPVREGDDVIPFIDTMARGVEGDFPVMDALGLHAEPTKEISTMYVEAYNLIVNYRNKNLSLDLPMRERLDTDLAAAHRDRGRHRDIVPSFDEAAMEGAIEIDLLNQGSLPVHGIGVVAGTTPNLIGDITPFAEADGSTPSYDNAMFQGHQTAVRTDASGVPIIDVQLQDADLVFSLASIDRAKKLRAYAQLRQRYSGLDKEMDIDKLMDGIRLPEKMFEQPILLGSQSSAFGFSKRYSGDSGNLDESIVQGAAMLSMQVATPRINTGGVLMFVAEIQPEQLFERQADPFLHITDVEEYPQFIRDDGDEQKVDTVFNYEIDTAHDDLTGLFGYGPLNGKFAVQGPRIGTGYFRPEATAEYDEDRARIWDTTPSNPSLGEDWYLAGNVSTEVFSFTDTEPFEASGRMSLVISGNTVFGMSLTESDGDYEAVEERLPSPDDQIDQNA